MAQQSIGQIGRMGADLSPYRARVEQAFYANTPEGKLQSAIQQAQLENQQDQLQRANNPLARQVEEALLQQKLLEAQQGKIMDIGPAVIRVNPTTGAVTKLYEDPAKVAAATRLQAMGLTTLPGGGTAGVTFNPVTGQFSSNALPEGVTEIRPIKGGGAKGGMTETSKANLLGRAGKFGLINNDSDLNAFRNDRGDLDVQKLALATGRAERESLDQTKQAKLDSVPAEVKSKVAAYQAVQKDLERLRERLGEEQASGDIPSATQDLISASLSDAPGNFFTRAFQRFVLQPNQSKTAAENERLRGAVSASIGRAIAGASLTATEKQNLIPFTPQSGDSFERLLEKSSGLEGFLNNQIEGLTAPRSGGSVTSPVATPGINPNAPNPVKIGRFTLIP